MDAWSLASRLRRPAAGLALLLLAGAAALALLRNHVLPLNGVVEAGGDHGLMTWNLWVVNESITSGHTPYFTRLVYHPLGARLAKHTLAAGFWPVTFLTETIIGGDPLYPVYAYRLSILVSFSLALVFTYLMLRRLGFTRLVALVPAVGFAFSSFNRLHVAHLNHISAAFLLPLTVLCLLRLLRRPGVGRAAELGAVLAAGVYFSELIVFVYVGLPLMALLAWASAPLRETLRARVQRLGWRGASALALSFVIVIAPFALNWAADQGKAPSPRQAWNWSANLLGFVVPNPDHTPLYGRLFAPLSAALKGIGGQEVFVGFPLLLFALLAVGRRPSGWTAVALGLAVFFFVLSLGPALKVGGAATSVPLPYALLMKVPPFEAGRTPVRCVLMGIFCLSFVAAAGLRKATDEVRRRWGHRAATGAALAVLAWAAAEVRQPVPAVPSYSIPRELEHLVPGPVVNVPVSFMDGSAVFLQVFHGQPIATGFVSRRTPEQLAHVREMERLLEEDVAAFLQHVQRLGVRNVILGPGTPDATAEQLLTGPLRVVDLRDPPLRRSGSP